ncbi:hypothetical protein FQZ97_1150980 [compost metagenome]
MRVNVFVVERNLADVGELDDHARRRQARGLMQRRGIEGAAPQTAGNAQYLDQGRIGHGRSPHSIIWLIVKRLTLSSREVQPP